MSTVRTVTWEDMFYLVLIATLWRTTSKYGSNMYQYEECWFAAVSCMWIRNDMLCRWWSSTLSSTQLFHWWIVSWWSQFFCFGARRWWKSSYRRQGYDSSAMSDDWTLYIDDFSVTRWPFLSRQFYCLRSRMLSLQLLQLERFRHLSTIFLSCNLIVKDSSSLHQSWWTLLHLNFSLSSVFCVVIDSIIAWTPTYCMALYQHCLVD